MYTLLGDTIHLNLFQISQTNSLIQYYSHNLTAWSLISICLSVLMYSFMVKLPSELYIVTEFTRPSKVDLLKSFHLFYWLYIKYIFNYV